jgi:hypothetical protein
MRRDRVVPMPGSVTTSGTDHPPHKRESPDRVGGPLRRGHGNSYKPTHPAFHGHGRWVGSCGRCGRHVESAAGQRKHPILGKLCTPCSEAMR